MACVSDFNEKSRLLQKPLLAALKFFPTSGQ